MLEKLLALMRWRDLDLRSVRNRLRPLSARHSEPSAILSLDDDPSLASEWLLETALAAADRARSVKPPLLEERGAPPLASTWPGEHYRLLAALVAFLAPRRVVEIGTFEGWSALAMLSELPEGATLTTFDLVPWKRFQRTLLREGDFGGDRLEQIVGDLGDPLVAERYAPRLRQAEMIFLDAAKDGELERRILDNFEGIGLPACRLLVLDDIRVWNMLDVWRQIRRPKLDLTSFGHWSGTGLVDWRNRGERAG